VTCKWHIYGTDGTVQKCRRDIIGAGSYCEDHQVLFDHRWDEREADPIEDLYSGMLVLSPGYNEKKYWGSKFHGTKDRRGKNEVRCL